MVTNRNTITVHGRRMAYVEAGSGPPVIFLHGNPTSSWLWRNVIPLVEGQARCLAPDLIGMGDSDKLPGEDPLRYSFAEHSRYVDGVLGQLVPDGPVTLVLHDWGSALGFDWARRHPDRVSGIAYMEAFVTPVSWADWPEASRGVFEGLRSPAGEKLRLEKNIVIERILPGSILRQLTEAELDEYRRPFAEPGEARRPMLTWPRQIPFDGLPADVHARVSDYSQWLAGSQIPKLFINAEPGAVLVGRQREVCRRWPNQTEVAVRGIHFIQEDSPQEIGAAVASWHQSL